MNEERFAKEMKKIQSVVSRALQKANTLAALVDGGKMSREKLQLTLEETAYSLSLRRSICAPSAKTARSRSRLSSTARTACRCQGSASCHR